MEATRTAHRPWMLLPRGQPLPPAVWRQRHRFMLGLVAAHAVLLPLFGIRMGETVSHALSEGAIVLAVLVLALLARSRTLQATFAALALVASSAILVHFSGGYIEAHFHFFVSLAFITLYQEWVPFAVTVAATVIHHGVVGAIEPTAVYNHAAALAEPWRWAMIHGLFVFAACTAYVVQWRLNEDARDEADVVLDAAGEAIVGVDTAGRVTFANPAARRLLMADDLHGRPVHALLRSWTGAAGERAEETRVLGPEIPVEVVTSPIVQRGRVTGHVLAIVDIRGRIEAEKERLHHRDEQLRRMQELDELKTSFLNTVAHELRTPVTPLRVQAGLLRRMSDDPATRQAAAVLDRNLERLHRLVDDVLEVTRLQAGGLVLHMQEVPLRTMLEDAVALYRPLAEQSDVAFSVSCDDVTIEADPVRFGQILHNLIANAVRCAPGGHVELTAAAQDGEAVLCVRDDGAGLTEAQLERLFQPFGQIEDGDPVQRQGTGLGLYVSREIAKLHGGTLTAASAGPGRGAVFTLTVPLKVDKPPLLAR